MLKSFFETQWGLTRNPFSGRATYAEDNQIVYVPECSTTAEEFLRKFVVAPLENGQPVLGAVWSVIPGDPKARGFGKSTMMGEEAKIINRDFGFETLTHLGISEDDAARTPCWPATSASTPRRTRASPVSTPPPSTCSAFCSAAPMRKVSRSTSGSASTLRRCW